ncbi:hypothetical protein [Haloferula sp. BvORR071]|uniref:8-oxoguanine DNA glycosylase OGG fold protein n=1 Tax=Haloferula sp. BvORR071 TaxID=1396141 RepID=UPI00224100DD|nr:hypothetical protein [Haloferula sp. BvORR071]
MLSPLDAFNPVLQFRRMPAPYQQPHWNAFIEIPPNAQRAVGHAPACWASKLPDVPPHYMLPTGPLPRTQLRRICRDPRTPVLIAYLCVMAWGGQGPANAVLTWKSRTLIEPILTKLRAGGLDGLQAYQLFTAGRKSRFPGLGPSYFTKLIYFFSPPGRSLYIVDNYVLASIEILTGLPHRYRATPGGYVAACREIDGMRKILSGSGARMEARLFSGKNKDWRRHANQQVLSRSGADGYRNQMMQVYSTGKDPIPPAAFW